MFHKSEHHLRSLTAAGALSKWRNSQVSVDKSKGRTILEDAIAWILHTDELWCEHSEASIARNDNCESTRAQSEEEKGEEENGSNE